jgi:hypothetical protein
MCGIRLVLFWKAVKDAISNPLGMEVPR